MKNYDINIEPIVAAGSQRHYIELNVVDKFSTFRPTYSCLVQSNSLIEIIHKIYPHFVSPFYTFGVLKGYEYMNICSVVPCLKIKDSFFKINIKHFKY